MASIKEKTNHEGPDEARLYKEGIFWVGYDQSAFLLSRVKPLRVTRKYVKCVGREVVSSGFPDSLLPKILENFNIAERRETSIVCRVRPDDVPADGDYEKWKSEIPVAAVASAAVPVASAAVDAGDVISRLRAFDLSRATPVDCLLFVSEIKELV